MITDVEQTIREYLPDVLHLSLATSSNGQPWVCEVHFVYDNELNLYFRSLKSRRHSQEITANPNVAGNIVAQHAVDQKPRGVYFEGNAKIIEGVNQDSQIFKLFRDRFGFNGSIVEQSQTEDGPKFYKIAVSKYYLFDAVESKPSQKYELAWTGHS